MGGNEWTPKTGTITEDETKMKTLKMAWNRVPVVLI